ncbi:MAG TPA: Gfo/Idh/MocA family oxidoreductase [Candidatus Limnocylindrales bacterium]|nr:Gfo/Idh/MocA family oxidoreductase [Candidatus Limnocylindrales bacterium]
MSNPEPIRWGILGPGMIAGRLLAGARRSSSAEVVAVGSRAPERAAQFAERYAIPTAHGSYEDLVADPRVEAVYIALPNGLHHPWTIRALAAGKHVLCEKPYSSDPADVEAAFDAADAAGLVLSEGFMWRHHPQVALLRSILPELGEIQAIRATFSFVLDEPANIRNRPDLDGGSLMDVGCYCISGARLVAGEEPELAFGVARTGPSGVDERFTGVLRFPGGIVAEFTCGFTADHRGLEVIGAAGSVRLTDPWASNPATLVRGGVETVIDEADPYQLELEDIGRAIREKQPPLLGRGDALGQARAIAALRESARTGRAVAAPDTARVPVGGRG